MFDTTGTAQARSMPHNGYAHNLQASPIEGWSRTYTSSPDCTSDSRGPSATGAGGRSQLVKRTVWFRGLLYGGVRTRSVGTQPRFPGFLYLACRLAQLEGHEFPRALPDSVLRLSEQRIDHRVLARHPLHGDGSSFVRSVRKRSHPFLHERARRTVPSP